MSELLTLNKKDPRFRSYIEGTFSKEWRALPIQSLNVNTEAEQVTFRLLAKEKITPPLLSLHWLQILKVRNLVFVAFPLLLVFLKNWSAGTVVDPVTGGLSALGAIFLMIAVSLRNDYLDHLSGLDRLHPSSESHAIQRGWVTAAQVKAWSSVYLVFGILCGLRALWLHSEILILVGALALLGIVGMSTFRMGLKYRLWSEWSAFLLLGPLLTVGFQISFGVGFDWQTAEIGFLTGWISVFYLHLKNFEQLMVNDQARFQNTMTWLGFERGRAWLVGWWLLFVVGWLAYQVQSTTLYWQALAALGCAFVTWPFLKSIRSLKSPLGSRMKTVIQLGHLCVMFVMAFWILETLWMMWLP